MTFSKTVSNAPDDYQITCIAASATLADEEQKNSAQDFIHRLMGCDRDNIAVVKEIYEEQFWEKNQQTYSFTDKPIKHAKDVYDRLVREIPQARSDDEISAIIQRTLPEINQDIKVRGNYRETLFAILERNEYINVMARILDEPMYIGEAINKVSEELERKEVIKEAQYEMLLYLALGGLAERDNAPLLRSKLHYFARGMQGVVATFDTLYSPTGKISAKPTLYFTGREALDKLDTSKHLDTGILDILTCRTCGQHYFVNSILLTQTEGKDNGELDMSQGTLDGDNILLKRASAEEGELSKRILVTDRLVAIEEDEDIDKKLLEDVWMCIRCASLTKKRPDGCLNTGCGGSKFVPMLLYKKQGNKIDTCIACGRQTGRGEPFTDLSATTVADVHILSQELIANLPSGSQKLIVFADSRQDAAFQAAWMADKASIYRTRHIIYEKLKEMEVDPRYQDDGKITPISLNDLALNIADFLMNETELSKLLMPDVHKQGGQDSYGKSLRNNTIEFLQYKIMLEATFKFRELDNLEGLGLAKYTYAGFETSDEFITETAEALSTDPGTIVETFKLLLDMMRKRKMIHGDQIYIYNKKWHPSNRPVLLGFLPYKAVKYGPYAMVRSKSEWKRELLERMAEHDIWFDGYLNSFYNPNGVPTVYQRFVAKCTGYTGETLLKFMMKLWDWLIKHQLLIPVHLFDTRDDRIPAGQVYEVNSRKMGMISRQNNEFTQYVCNICYRHHIRLPVNNICSRSTCKGTLEKKDLPEENYDINLLKSEFMMMIPKEHTAQVPTEVRLKYEEEFKKSSGSVNCLVATPTLELGVDIGSLDVVLQRNIPPTPTNYWQRAGRSGRRNRTGVIFSYARKFPHDTHFFNKPSNLLKGNIEPPKFNLRNQVMIGKHIHAILISGLYQIQIETDDQGLANMLKKVFPPFIKDFVYDVDQEGKTVYIDRRWEMIDIESLTDYIKKHQDYLQKLVISTFNCYWPKEDKFVIDDEFLNEIIDDMPKQLLRVIRQIQRRFLWATQEINNYNTESARRKLEDEEEKNLRKYRNLRASFTQTNIKNYTLNYLSREGFLPAYLASGDDYRAEMVTESKYLGTKQFQIYRSAAIALAEYAPGNSLYANGGLYTPTTFEFKAAEESIEPRVFSLQDHIFDEGVRDTFGFEEGSPQIIKSVPLADIQLKYIDRVNSSEEFRRGMSVEILGKPLDHHSGGEIYEVGEKEIHFMKNQKVLLLNTGATFLEMKGYPICSVCGGTRSPMASVREIDFFIEHHRDKSCGRSPEFYAIHTETEVDGIKIPVMETQKEIINLVEGIVFGMANTLSIEREDVRYFIFSEDPEHYQAFLYDPMKGGSGIITQLIEQWQEVLTTAINYLNNCNNGCDTSCYQCLRTFWNMRYHEILNRHTAAELLEAISVSIEKKADIPENMVDEGPEGITEVSTEIRFAEALKSKGLTTFEMQKEIKLNFSGIKRTIPDFVFEDEIRGWKLAIYIDGLSTGIHGNPRTAKVDALINIGLKKLGWKVERIAASVLDDPDLLEYYASDIASILSED